MTAWTSIPGYSGRYEVCRDGKIRRIGFTDSFGRRHKTKTLKIGGSLYPQVSVTIDGRRNGIYVHRALALAFIPNPMSLPCINHIDGNPKNFELSNLEWVTHSDNMIHARKLGMAKTKLSEKQIHAIRALFVGGMEGNSQLLADATGLSREQVCNIARGRQWSWLS